MEDGWPFAVQAVALYLGETPSYDSETQVLRFGDQLSVQLDRFNRLPIDFLLFPLARRGMSRTLGFPCWKCSASMSSKRMRLGSCASGWRTRSLFSGDTSEVSHDYFETPVGRLYGVELIGATVATLLAGAGFCPQALASRRRSP